MAGQSKNPQDDYDELSNHLQTNQRTILQALYYERYDWSKGNRIKSVWQKFKERLPWYYKPHGFFLTKPEDYSCSHVYYWFYEKVEQIKVFASNIKTKYKSYKTRKNAIKAFMKES